MDEIIREHVLDVLKQIPDESIDCVVTSPPYWSLRDYKTNGLIWDGVEDCEHEWGALIDFPSKEKRDLPKQIQKSTLNGAPNATKETIPKDNGQFCQKCGAWRGSLGLEPTFQLYLQHLLQIFDEVKRVLKKTGTCWINLGDTYASGTRDNNGIDPTKMKSKEAKYIGTWHEQPNRKMPNYSPKSLCQIPFRFAIGMVDNGWIHRNTIIWHKPNCMPQSVKDRFTVDFEYVFFFVKSKKYYFEQQFEPLKEASLKRWHGEIKPSNQNRNNPDISPQGINTIHKIKSGDILNHQGRNRRCVWTIPTSPFKDAHFATFPEALIEPMIKAGCPEFVCRQCGKARGRIYEVKGKSTTQLLTEKGYSGKRGNNKVRQALDHGGGHKDNIRKKVFIGYTDCGCNAGFDGGIVFDPFIGSGTTAVVVQRLKRHYLGIELNEEYCLIARKRIV